MIERHVQPDSASYYKYHGFGRESNAENLSEFDIVFTTYATVTSEFCRGLSILHQIKWFRIVLDEGKQAFDFDMASSVDTRDILCLCRV